MLKSELAHSNYSGDASKIVRFGILGTARITPISLIQTAKQISTVKVIAVASQSPKRVKYFAKEHGISRVYSSYDELMSDPEIDAVYNPLPNSMHCEWTIRALEAGKHVLCEKPIASNAAEAEKMAKTAVQNRRILAEAFHYCHHPMMAQVKRIIDNGEIGTLQHIDVKIHLPLFISPSQKDFRYQYELSGGVTMDIGCYAIHLLRFLVGIEPNVTFSQVCLACPQIDSWVAANFQFFSENINCTASMNCAFSSLLPKNYVKVQGEQGKLKIYNPYFPHLLYNSIFMKNKNSNKTERFIRNKTTYFYQLYNFIEAIVKGIPLSTNPSDAIANMRVIDAIYQKAGLKPRGMCKP